MLATGERDEHFPFVEISAVSWVLILSFPILCGKIGLEIGEALAPPSEWKEKESSIGVGHSCERLALLLLPPRSANSDKLSSGVRGP